VEVTVVRDATSADLAAVEALRRADGADLGFIPQARYEHIVLKTLDRGRPRWEYERLFVSIDAREITGFLLGSLGKLGGKIEQVCVRADARRMERALALTDCLEAQARSRGIPLVRCRVAHDIEANLFWSAAGYLPIGMTMSTFLNTRASKSRRPIIQYEKLLNQGRLWPLESVLEV
jgi:predicted GNAT superfamily acetyltransferase